MDEHTVSNSQNSIKDSGYELQENSLSHAEEYSILLKGIEELSKQARNILLVLLTTSSYVLVAAFSSSITDKIKLPLVAIEVDQSLFLAVGPIAILLVYVYLHVYVREFQGRLFRIENFRNEYNLQLYNPDDMLYPWILGFAVQQQERKKRRAVQADSLGRSNPIKYESQRFLFVFAVALIWFLGPLVLLTLYLRFVNQQQVISLIPCFAIIITLWIGASSVTDIKSRFLKNARLTFSFLFFLVTLASVQELREKTYLSKVWELTITAISLIERFLSDFWVLSTIGIILPALGLWLLWYLIFNRIFILRRYLTTLYHRISKIQHPWFDGEKNISEVFIPLKVKSNSSEEKVLHLREVILDNQNGVIVGPPGSGKSMALFALALDSIQRKILTQNKKQFVPVFLRLSELQLNDKSLYDLAARVFEPIPDKTAKRLLKKLTYSGRVIYLFDGLDEINSKHIALATRKINKFIVSECLPHGSRIFLTSRPNNYVQEFSGTLSVLTLQPLTYDQIRNAVSMWHENNARLKEKILSFISISPSIIELCGNPLMLTVIVWTFFLQTDFSRTSSTSIIDILVDVLISGWDEVRGLALRNELSHLLKKKILKDLATKMVFLKTFSVEENFLLETANDYITSRAINYSADELVKELIGSGLLVKLPNKNISFSHRAFQKYLSELNKSSII